MTDFTELPEQLVYLIVRFATSSIPDLPLSIHFPHTTTTLSLKQLIRQELPPSHASSRLRIIYSGKVLADTTPLSTSLRLPPPAPPRDGASDELEPGSKGKGKQPARGPSPGGPGGSAEAQASAKKFYIHCSLGDALSPSELASEAILAQSTEQSLQSQHLPSEQFPSDTSGNADTVRRRSSTATGTAPQPQGFDRLLTSGFTPQEVASLRSHFQTNLSFTYTPDTMPSAAEMRALEDRWLDSTATDPSQALIGEGGGTADAGWGAGFAVEDGGLDDMLWGYMTGFFFALPALVWGFREEGVWSRRRQLAVVVGVMINAVFGFMRWSA